MIPIKKPDEIERMRASCAIAARVLDDVAAKVGPGVTTAELDAYGKERMEALGAESAFYGYRGYPAYICTSVNDEVVHGIPGSYALQLGDIISIDVGTTYDGWIGDNARTIMVGVQDPEVVRLVQVTERALAAGIAKAVTGGKLSDISHEVEKVIVDSGLYVVKDFVGHGVGRSMHEEPQIPNFGPPGRGPRLKTGMTLAIEPMVNLGTEKVDLLSDGWTIKTKDRRPSAHFEHTVLVQEDSPEILTCKKKS